MRHRTELDGRSRRLPGEAFARAEIERHSLPAYGALVNLAMGNRPHSVENINFLISNFIGIERDRRFHGHEAKKLV